MKMLTKQVFDNIVWTAAILNIATHKCYAIEEHNAFENYPPAMYALHIAISNELTGDDHPH